jgi:uncharacterized protein (DUF488 family)
MTPKTVLTIGHSTHDFATFAGLLQQHHITAVADVRSTPASRFAPQFNRNAVERDLRAMNIKYVFMGEELGARTDDTSCYVDGKVQYSLLAKTPEFTDGVERIVNGARTERIAVMCTEGEPLDCHRTILVARVLSEHGVTVSHIHGDGSIENHGSAMERLMLKFGLAEADLFNTHTERLEQALSRQEQRIAYVNEGLRADERSDT